MSHDIMELAQQFSKEEKEIQASIEESLIFQYFDSQVAFGFRSAFGEEPTIRIERLSDGAAIFQYIGFALRKMAAVRVTGF